MPSRSSLGSPNEAVLAPSVRFQVSLPTPMALLCGFVAPADRLALEVAVEAAMRAELGALQAAIPADRLSLQWDVAFEVLGVAGGPPLPYADGLAGSLERLARLCAAVNPKAQLGVHLCYGDPGHRHIVEPADLAVCVAFANGLTRVSPHLLDYFHMPVPRDRADEAYFAPLEALSLPDATRLVLGLVHLTDGVEGAARRMAAAARFRPDFDIATECGFGRRDPATVPQLLRIHRALCDLEV
jgi:hypothetical protein